jgi:hypothetical protein
MYPETLIYTLYYVLTWINLIVDSTLDLTFDSMEKNAQDFSLMTCSFCSSCLPQVTCHCHFLHPPHVVQAWDSNEALVMALLQSSLAASYSSKNPLVRPNSLYSRYFFSFSAFDIFFRFGSESAICHNDDVAGRAGLSSFRRTGSFGGGKSWLAFIKSSNETRPDSGRVFLGLLAVLESADDVREGVVRRNGETVDRPPRPLLDFRPFLPTAATADSGFGKLLTTLRKLATRPLPSLPYRVFSSFSTRSNALCTAAWFDMFLPTGLTSPMTVASQELSLDDCNTNLTMVNASFSESSPSIIWVLERCTSEPFRSRSKDVVWCAPIMDPLAISWCSEACRSSSRGVAGGNVQSVRVKFLSPRSLPLFNHRWTWIQQKYITKRKRQWQLDICCNITHNWLAVPIFCSISRPRLVFVGRIQTNTPNCSNPTSGRMSHRVRRSFLVFPLAVPKLGRSRCTDTPAYMNFLNCVSNESYCSSSSRDNPVRNGKGSLDEATIYQLPPLPKVERLYCHELAESVRKISGGWGKQDISCVNSTLTRNMDTINYKWDCNSHM